MATADAQGEIGLAEPTRRHRLRWQHSLLLPALPAVGLMVLWAEHDGGYDADTWYWGALALLGLLAATAIALGSARARLSRYGLVALAGLVAYTAWSYLSVLWAQSPGLALQGSNRTLLYLLMFTLLLILPWTPRAALAALTLFTVGVGALGVLLLVRLAGSDHVQQLIVQGRLVAPTGYFNSSAALFMIATLLAVALAARRDLPPPLRGVLIAFSCASLQLCVLGQSRGWLFTLPLVALVAIATVQDRVRYAVASVLPIAATVAALHPLLGVFKARASAAVVPAAAHAGRVCLLTCAVAFALGTLLAWAEARVSPRKVPRGTRLALGAAIAVVMLAGAAAGAIRVTHGHPVAFISRQWRGFTHPQPQRSSGSHFTAVGSGRYDFWRVSLEALRAHPLGGLGQDNFADYYVTHRRTREEPASAHSLEMSLLAETGVVGFILFVVFLGAAVAGALRARFAGTRTSRGVAGAAMLPFVVWMIHGSVDWFWEMPAISAAALGFLGIAVALDRPAPDETATAARSSPRPIRRAAIVTAAAITLLACTAVLAFPYLSVREVSLATDIASSNPSQALRDLSTAGQLNPLSPDPGRIGGTIALQTGQYSEAERSFAQATAREPRGWYAWLGAGLAASALGHKRLAKHDLMIAAQINPGQRVVKKAVARVLTAHPLAPADALRMLVLVN
jgi:O-Antigen ligase